MDAQTRQVVEELSRELAAQRKELAALKRAQRAPQLAHSSLEEGQAVEVRAEDGTVRQRWGWQPDGSVAVVTEGGDPVSAPTAPTVTPSIAGLKVTWDGTLADPDIALPADFDHMAVHVSDSSGFTPDATTYQGTIRRAGEGGTFPVAPLPYVLHYVVLIPVTTGGIQGTPSAEASGTPVQVDGPDLTAGSVTAGTIAAGAVTADKLEAILVLASQIVGGTLGAARVEMDSDGLRGYDDTDTLIFAIDTTSGNAVFSGDITGSEITGSRMVIGAEPGNVGVIEDASGTVRAQVTSSTGQRARISATTGQADFTAWADPTTASEIGGMVAQTGLVALTMQSVNGDNTQPYVQEQVEPGRAAGAWISSFTGSSVVIQALPDFASIRLTAPAAVDPDDAQGAGYLFTQRYVSDIAAVSMQGPEWSDNTGPEYQLRAMLHLEGARPERAYTRATYATQRHVFHGEWDGTAIDATADGVVELADTHSVLAARHQPAQSTLASQPGFGTTGSFVDFSSGEWPSIPFRTSWSGWTRITVQCAGINHSSDVSSFATSFRLSGGSTVAAALSRCAYIRSRGAGLSEPMPETAVFYLQLAGNSDYTLTPAWRISSGSSATASYYTVLDNTITVEPLT